MDLARHNQLVGFLMERCSRTSSKPCLAKQSLVFFSRGHTSSCHSGKLGSHSSWRPSPYGNRVLALRPLISHLELRVKSPSTGTMLHSSGRISRGIENLPLDWAGRCIFL